jgi:hypothetical protein
MGLSKAAKIVEEGVAEKLSYMAFPRALDSDPHQQPAGANHVGDPPQDVRG